MPPEPRLLGSFLFFSPLYIVGTLIRLDSIAKGGRSLHWIRRRGSWSQSVRAHYNYSWSTLKGGKAQRLKEEKRCKLQEREKSKREWEEGVGEGMWGYILPTCFRWVPFEMRIARARRASWLGDCHPRSLGAVITFHCVGQSDISVKRGKMESEKRSVIRYPSAHSPAVTIVTVHTKWEWGYSYRKKHENKVQFFNWCVKGK